MVGPITAAAWRLALLLCHASVLFPETQGFSPAATGAAGAAAAAAAAGSYGRHQAQELKLKYDSHRRQLLAAVTPLAATRQREQLDDSVWWEGEVDPWVDAGSRVRSE